MCAQATSQPPPTAAAAAEGLTGQPERPCSPPPPGGAAPGPARPHPPGPPRQTAGRRRRSANSSRADGLGSPQWPRGARVGGGRRGAGGARLEAGAAASRPRGGRRGSAGPSPWAPQDARTEPAPGTSNDKPPASPSPRRTSSGRGAAGARKTRPGAAAGDRPPQPARAHGGPTRKPGLDFPSLCRLQPLWKSGEREGDVQGRCVGTGSGGRETGARKTRRGFRRQLSKGKAPSPAKGEMEELWKGYAKPGLD